MKEIVEQINKLTQQLIPLKDKIDKRVKEVALIYSKGISQKFPYCDRPVNTNQIDNWQIENDLVTYFWNDVDDRIIHETFPSFFIHNNEALNQYVECCNQIEQERKNLQEILIHYFS